MDLGIAGRVAVVQAASRGLGFATALELAREGASVAICARRQQPLEEARSRIETETGARVLSVAFDVTDAGEREAFFARVEAELGAASILVCNAGGPPPRAFADTTAEDFVRAIDANFLSAVESCRRVLPAMRAARWRRLALITSIAVTQPVPGLILSNAARAGVTGFAKTLASEVAQDGVTVNCVLPGTHKTDRIDHLLSGGGDAMERELVAQIPAGRMGSPEEFAAVVAFLCSSRASFVTGVSLGVDGGAVRSLL